MFDQLDTSDIFTEKKNKKCTGFYASETGNECRENVIKVLLVVS